MFVDDLPASVFLLALKHLRIARAEPLAVRADVGKEGGNARGDDGVAVEDLDAARIWVTRGRTASSPRNRRCPLCLDRTIAGRLDMGRVEHHRAKAYKIP